MESSIYTQLKPWLSCKDGNIEKWNCGKLIMAAKKDVMPMARVLVCPLTGGDGQPCSGGAGIFKLRQSIATCTQT